ncbi:glycosyltransferase [Sedimentibacter saalensis]|uniref:glycosyltransferase n=1 Tax=Sedimentibacter saalensis TaxID=130788 RepID=UPI0028975C18|nr:glycosyltransferase [Sedimentibacter saalensis]
MIINKEKNFVSAVIYVNNNERTIEEFIKYVDGVLNDNFEKYEIICVNDFSTDKSIEKIKSITNRLNGLLSILNMSFYQGIELSMNAGVDLAIGDFVFEFDSTIIDYPKEMIMNVYNHSLKGFDIVSVAPIKTKNKSSKTFYALFNKFSKTTYKLRTESFRILSRRAINRVHSMSSTIPYRKAFYSNCGLKSDVILYDNDISNKNIHSDKQIEKRKDTAVNSLILFTDIGYKFAIILSGIMILVTMGTALYTLIIFLSRKPVEGWTTTMLFLSFAFFGLFALGAVIIKYLTVILDLIFKKQKYTIESIEKVKK